MHPLFHGLSQGDLYSLLCLLAFKTLMLQTPERRFLYNSLVCCGIHSLLFSVAPEKLFRPAVDSQSLSRLSEFSFSVPI